MLVFCHLFNRSYIYIYIYIYPCNSTVCTAAAPCCCCCWELRSRNWAPGRLEVEAVSCSSIRFSLFLIRMQNCFEITLCSSSVPSMNWILVFVLSVNPERLLHERICSCVSSCLFWVSHLRGHSTHFLNIFFKLHFIPLIQLDLSAVSMFVSLMVKRFVFR